MTNLAGRLSDLFWAVLAGLAISLLWHVVQRWLDG